MGTYLDPTCIDPQQITSIASLNISGQLVDRLTDQDPDTGAIIPWLAESWDVNAEATSFTFHLKQGVTFSDGNAFNAQVVKDNFDSIVALGAKAPSASNYLSGYEGSSVVDDSTVTVTFQKPNAQFLQATSTIPLGIVSTETTQKTTDQRCADGVVGTGPFVFESYAKNESTVLTKRTGYQWAPSTRAHNGDAYLDKVTIKVIPEDGVRTGALTSDNVQLIDNVADQDASTLQASGDQLLTKPQPGFVVSALFNMASPLGQDEAVRKATMLAVNRDDLASLAGIAGFRATSYLASQTPGSLDLSDKLTYDPDEAKSILDEAGWTIGSDGVREKDGTRLSLRLPYFFSGDVVELFQQQLAAVGIEAKVQQVSNADYTATLNSGNYDVTTNSWARSDPAALNSIVSSWYHQSDPQLLSLLDQQNSTVDATQRANVTEQVQNYVFDNAFAVPLWGLQAIFGIASGVQGVSLDGSSRLVLVDAWAQQ